MTHNLEIDIPEATASQAWEDLKSDPSSVLVDVRTIAEWDYVGVPDLESIDKEILKVEWMEFPEMTRNDFFAEELLSQLEDEEPTKIYFMCRSGRRSRNAARCVAEKQAGKNWKTQCINISDGFEGDHDENHHRGTVNGWKVSGLPWKQS